jgi:hypothetical protein
MVTTVETSVAPDVDAYGHAAVTEAIVIVVGVVIQISRAIRVSRG